MSEVPPSNPKGQRSRRPLRGQGRGITDLHTRLLPCATGDEVPVLDDLRKTFIFTTMYTLYIHRTRLCVKERIIVTKS